MKSRIILIILFMASNIFLARSQTFYVSPNGSGSAFSYESPGSLEGARDAIRLINQNMSADVHVILKDGMYNLSSTFSLTSNDSGENGFRIIYEAENPRQACFSGGIKINSWSEVDSLWEADVPAGAKFRQIYVDGTRGIRSREPNQGYSYQIKSWDENNKTIVINGNEIYNWNHLTQVEMVIHKHWNYSRLRINSFTLDNAEATVVPMQPERDVEFNFKFPAKENSQSYYYENAKEFIDEPGEWYHDTTLNKIYYLPREGETIASDFIIPVLETLISVEEADNIEFRDLVFQYSNWTAASEIGFVGGQGGYYKANINGTMTNFIPKTGAISIKNCENVTLTGNLIHRCGAMGVDLISGNKNTKVIGNVFNRIAGNGITVTSDTHGTPCTNDTIANNYFIRCADIYSGSVPVISTYSSNTVIEHNEIAQAPYSGISVGWGWTLNPTTLQNTKVNYNYVHDFMYFMEDGGGIYTLSYQPNSTIKENLIENAFASDFTEKISPVAGIYLDQGTGGFSIINNVLRNIENINTTRITDNIYTSAQAGENTITGTTTSNPTVEENAGIENQFQGIKSWVDTTNLTGRGTILHKQNIALNKPTTASQEYSTNYGSNKSNDGDYSTLWSSGSPTSDSVWWQVDLFGVYKIGLIELVARQDIDQPFARKNFEIRASNSEGFSNYVILAVQGEEPFEDKGKWVCKIQEENPYRYIRVIKTDGTGFNFSEIRIEGELINSVGDNIVLNKPTQASGSYNSDYGSEKGNDDDVSTIWASGSSFIDYAWWKVDLENNYILQRIELVPRQDVDQEFARKNIEIQASESANFATYTVLASIGETPFNNQETWSSNISDGNSFRYIRLVKSDGTPFNFAELLAYGEEVTESSDDNIVLGKTTQASGSYNSNYSSEKGNDDDVSTIWASGSSFVDFAWWQVDLDSNYILQKVELVPRQDVDQEFARKNIEIQVSDSANFSTYIVLATVGETPFNHQETWSTDISASNSFRYIRVMKSDGTPFNFAEFRAYGVEDNYQLPTKSNKNKKNLFYNLIVSPNPAKDHINVSSNQEIDMILIYNIHGNRIMNQTFHSYNVNLDISNLMNGVYFVQVISDSEKQTVKIVKN